MQSTVIHKVHPWVCERLQWRRFSSCSVWVFILFVSDKTMTHENGNSHFVLHFLCSVNNVWLNKPEQLYTCVTGHKGDTLFSRSLPHTETTTERGQWSFASYLTDNANCWWVNCQRGLLLSLSHRKQTKSTKTGAVEKQQ